MERDLTDAIAGLHEAGRIRTRWLPGMRIAERTDLPGYSRGRVMSGNPNGGIRLLEWDTAPAGQRTWSPSGSGVLLLHVNDPATLGCLLFLLREASGDPHAYVRTQAVATGMRWQAYWLDRCATADTEGEALAAALIDLARAA